MEYSEDKNIVFHLMDESRGIDVRFLAILTLEDDLIKIAKNSGFSLVEKYFDYGQHSSENDASWKEFVFGI